jgi:hypothetical protein
MEGYALISNSKPCLASKPRAFMIFQTIGLNTGRVRLDTLILGLCCASDAVVQPNANAQAVANVASLRRESATIKFSL